MSIPKGGSGEWKRNETIINNNPVLKQARDISEGIAKPSHKYGTGSAGKGSAVRPGNSQLYKDNWEKIFGKKDKTVE